MKRKLFWAALVGIALTSCVSDEGSPVDGEKKLMRFDAPVFKTQSRANVKGEINGTSYPKEESFKVYAYTYTGAFNESTTWKSYFAETGEEATNGASSTGNTGTSNYWVTTTAHYWPDAAHNMAFIAYSPAVDVTGTITHEKETGLKIEGFQTESNSDDQYDLMFSNRVLDRNVTTHGNLAVPLVFNHALSSIVFSAQRDENSPETIIKQIKVNGTFITKGDFNQGISGSTIDGVYTEKNNPSWSVTSTTASEYAPSFTAFTVPSSNPAQFTKGNSALLMIPQNVPNDASVTVHYTTGASGSVENTKTIKLKDFIVTSTSQTIPTWEMGKRYVYRIQFGASHRIYFEPSVTDWVQHETAIFTINSGASSTGAEP